MSTTIGADSSALTASAYASQASAAEKTQSTEKKNNITGKTIGEPKLSDKGAKYYEQLKAKYGNYEFILVSKDQKENAQANAAKYASKDHTVVLIDEEKIEKMATDESYRKKYENILSGAQAQLEQMAKQMGNTPGLKGFGIKVNDNGAASFFAAIDKNAAANATAQKKRQAKAAEKKAAEKKNAARQTEKKREEKRTEKKKAEKQAQEERMDTLRKNRIDGQEDADYGEEDIEVVSAGSIDELIKMIQNVTYATMSDSVRTEAELALGGHIDFKG